MSTVAKINGGNPWIVQAREGNPHGKERATFYRVTGIDMATGELLAVPSTDESEEPTRFPSLAISVTEDGATNWLFRDPKDAWSFCAGAGFRFPILTA